MFSGIESYRSEVIWQLSHWHSVAWLALQADYSCRHYVLGYYSLLVCNSTRASWLVQCSRRISPLLRVGHSALPIIFSWKVNTVGEKSTSRLSRNFTFSFCYNYFKSVFFIYHLSLIPATVIKAELICACGRNY